MNAPVPNTIAKSRQLEFAYLAVIVITLTLLVMGRLCFNAFVDWDDYTTVAQNPRLNPPALATVQFYWLHSAYRIYIPLTYTVWTALASIARTAPDARGITLDPLVFHGANVLAHVLAALVVCKILLLLRLNRLGALGGSLVFAVHPVQVEAVAWVSGLKDVLSGLLALAALWQYLEFASRAKEGRPGAIRLFLAMAFLILAVFAKPSAVTVPLAAIALDRFILCRPWRAVLAAAAPMAVLVVPFVFIARNAQAIGAASPIWQRPLIACDAMTFYLFKLIWPAHLCFDYGRRPATIAAGQSFHFAWLVPAALAGVLFWKHRRAPILIGATLVFIAGCLTNLGLAPFSMQYYSTAADHYLYWAMLGPAIAVGWALTAFPASAILNRAAIATIIVWSLLSIRQGGFWADNFALYQHAIAVSPQSFVSYNNLGNAYSDASNLPMAADMYQKSIAANPKYVLAYTNLARALRSLHELDQSTQQLKLAIALQQSMPPRSRPAWVMDLNLLALNFMESGNPQQAAAVMRQSLASNPDQPEVTAMLALAESGKPYVPASQASSPQLQQRPQTMMAIPPEDQP